MILGYGSKVIEDVETLLDSVSKVLYQMRHYMV